jgi:hypothetical protein
VPAIYLLIARDHRAHARVPEHDERGAPGSAGLEAAS